MSPRYVVLYLPSNLLLLGGPHRWTFASPDLIAERRDMQAQGFTSRRAAWRAIDSYGRSGRTVLRPVKVG